MIVERLIRDIFKLIGSVLITIVTILLMLFVWIVYGFDGIYKLEEWCRKIDEIKRRANS